MRVQERQQELCQSASVGLRNALVQPCDPYEYQRRVPQRGEPLEALRRLRAAGGQRQQRPFVLGGDRKLEAQLLPGRSMNPLNPRPRLLAAAIDPRRVMLAFALALAVLLTVVGISLTGAPGSGVVGSLRVEVAAVGAADAIRPAVSREAAERNARDMLVEMEPGLRGLSVSAAGHVPALKRLITQTGDSEFDSTTPINAWVLEFVGEPTAAYKSVSAVVVVDAMTGKVKAASLDQTN